MHCRYFSMSDCSIRVSRSFVQFLCPLHKNCSYYASILLIAFTHPLCQKFFRRNRWVPSNQFKYFSDFCSIELKQNQKMLLMLYTGCYLLQACLERFYNNEYKHTDRRNEEELNIINKGMLSISLCIWLYRREQKYV